MSKFGRIAFTFLLLVFATFASGESISGLSKQVDLIRATERQRLRALVEANVEVARRLHADDFQLINPLGETLSKEQYLEGIASGELDYLVFEADSSIEVRLYGTGAVIRYRSKLEIVVKSEKVPLGSYWHTDVYEKRKGTWQIVWSQATAIG